MNQHSPDKEPLSLQIPRTLKVRLYRMAQKQRIKVSELVVKILLAETAQMPISSSDYEAIAKATKRSEETGKRLATILDDSTGPKS